MSLYIIQSTGEMTECENKEVALSSNNVLLVISHEQKRIYTWMGNQAAPQSKFACARETSRIRMELGYKIMNLEESDTSNDFLEAVNEACNIATKPTKQPAPVKRPEPTPEVKKEEKAKTKTEPKPATKTAAKPKPKPKPKTTAAKTAAKPKPKTTAAKTAAKSKTEPKKDTTRRYNSTAVETEIVDVEHVIKQLEILQPMSDSIRDYVIIGDTLFVAPENLEKPNTESKVSLPDGSFVADDYIPRLFLENGKIIAIELWRES
ncbi:MAG: hypothetical protein ACXAAM_06510 [Candidatus Heimdallarchaeaceae archaeon]